MKTSKPVIATIVLTACATQNALAAELRPGTLVAWNSYLKEADFQMQGRAAGRRPFLWMYESTDRAARVRHGEVVVAPASARGAQAVPNGLVHDWVGAIFIPGASIDGLWAVVHSYDNYRHMYQPAVASSRTLACRDTSQEFQMVWQRQVLFVNAAMQGHYQVHDVRLDSRHGYSVAEAVEVREIEGYGHAGEHLLPPDTGSGFIWRIRSITRFEERDGGTGGDGLDARHSGIAGLGGEPGSKPSVQQFVDYHTPPDARCRDFVAASFRKTGIVSDSGPRLPRTERRRSIGVCFHFPAYPYSDRCGPVKLQSLLRACL